MRRRSLAYAGLNVKGGSWYFPRASASLDSSRVTLAYRDDDLTVRFVRRCL